MRILSGDPFDPLNPRPGGIGDQRRASVDFANVVRSALLEIPAFAGMTRRGTVLAEAATAACGGLRGLSARLGEIYGPCCLYWNCLG